MHPNTFSISRRTNMPLIRSLKKVRYALAAIDMALLRSFSGILCILTICCAPSIAAEGHWVTTWGCGPQLTEPNNLPPAPLANSTLRQFVHVTLGGKHLRVRFSNAYGTNAVTINSAHIALSAGAGSAGTGEINTSTDKALTFH